MTQTISAPTLEAAFLESAVDRGIIDHTQRAQLVELLSEQKNSTEPAPLITADEPFRLVGGGMDVFVGLGTAVLLIGVTSALFAFGATMTTGFAAMLAITWALGEFLTRLLKLKFTSLILAAVFAPSLTVLVGSWVWSWFGLQRLTTLEQEDGAVALLKAIVLRDDLRTAVWIGVALVAVGAITHFWRFRVPIMSAVLAICVLALGGYTTVDVYVGQLLSGQVDISDPEFVSSLIHTVLITMLICGLGLFAVGVALDLTDKHRNRVTSDCAFWMHVLSAPLIVHPIFVLLTGRFGFLGALGANEVPGEDGTLWLVAVLVIVFFYVSLIIDRRSLLVPSLAYLAGIATYLLVESGATNGGTAVFPIIMVLVGASVILFGVLWHRLRALVVRITLPHMIASRLPPLLAR